MSGSRSETRYSPSPTRRPAFARRRGRESVAQRKAAPRTAAREGTVYLLDGDLPRAIPIQTGITDGRDTEILAGDLKRGDQVVVGASEAAAEMGPSTLRTSLFCWARRC